ncbi:arylesterase [Candidatus Gracilibacteria bacterium]|nr:arylesterase [Candidatus Gracilibacteria bacterium]
MKKYWVSIVIILLAGYFWFFSNSIPDGNPNEFVHSGVIVVFGDSLTAGHGVEEQQNYPALLQFRLNQEGYPHYNVLNFGIDGDTTKDGLERTETLFEHQPEIVIVALGANDAFQRVPLEETRKNLKKILEKIQNHKAKIILAGIVPPPTRGFSYIGAFEEMYKELAREFDAVLMPSLLSGVMLRSEYNLSDNIHPNPAGYRIITDNLWSYVHILLRKE